jgi:hypothetical protein
MATRRDGVDQAPGAELPDLAACVFEANLVDAVAVEPAAARVVDGARPASRRYAFGRWPSVPRRETG